MVALRVAQAVDAADLNVSVFNWNRGQDELIGGMSVKVRGAHPPIRTSQLPIPIP